MKIGTLLNLKLKDPHTGVIDKYRSKIIEKNEHYLFIDYPINEQTRKTAFLPKGTIFSAAFAETDKAIYQFRSEIVAKVKLNVPALAIKLPDKSKIQRIQRREFVRIDAAVDVAIHSSEYRFPPFATVTSDISGGGLSIIVPKGIDLDTGLTVDVWLALPFNSGKYEYVYTQAEIVFIKTINHSIVTASLKFISVTKKAQQIVISYCFEKQREARKKELT
ncbi:hypothetical protein CIL05_11655 [Virgibacillus profundi]|uniref:Pilus assembly protein PilZ n=1 Tax=Virgibacillus profundi TaxID=2024555 RepID=A0A2A2IE26_9BACI|nr:flagellar brake domain-containing protein [Virgibacillus profundi]PAV29514.1 hypothetical protein CIL05_11655 [Virgibacillus profundi]PXY53684.1 hypothetical protein CIT14_11770 [Virgibacillus profundi]